MSDQPFTGVEDYYCRLFQQIKKRHNPDGTGGDMGSLIAMIEWLWKRSSSAQLAATHAAIRALRDEWHAQVEDCSCQCPACGVKREHVTALARLLGDPAQEQP